MAYPSIATFPPSPSRTGDPDNFYLESTAFLDAFADYETESNALATYINAKPIDGWNWGTVVDVNPTQPVIAPMPPMPSPSDSGLVFTTKADNFLASLEDFSYTQNLVGDYIDDLAVIAYSATLQADANRPVVSMLTAHPSRGQSQSEFEAKSQAWGTSIINYSVNLDAFSDYYKALVTDNDDFGLVTETVTDTIDYNA